MIVKIFCSLVIGSLVGGVAYLFLGLCRRGGSENSAGKRGTGGKPMKGQKVVRKKPRKDDDDDIVGGKSGDSSALAPTKEWVGGSRG